MSQTQSPRHEQLAQKLRAFVGQEHQTVAGLPINEMVFVEDEHQRARHWALDTINASHRLLYRTLGVYAGVLDMLDNAFEGKDWNSENTKIHEHANELALQNQMMMVSLGGLIASIRGTEKLEEG